MNIGIIGAGIGGLTAAIAFRQRGWRVTVLEKAPGFTQVGAGISLSPNATLILKALGLGDALEKKGAVLKAFITADQTGKILGQTNVEGLAQRIGTEALGIHRSDMHDVLVEVLGHQRIICNWAFGRLLQQDAKGVEMMSTDGDRRQFDIVVGADGVHSPLRTAVLGASPLRNYGQYCWRGVVSGRVIPQVASDHRHTATEYWGKGQRFGIVPIDAQRFYWYAVTDEDLITYERAEVSELQKQFDRWDDLIKAVIGATEPSAIVHGPLVDKAPTGKWFDQRIVFLGDAIHPTTPNLGQGAGMAIESAWTLAHCLAKNKNHAHAFKEYFALRTRRTSLITKRSYTIGKIAQTRSESVRFFRNQLMRLIPASVQENALARLILSNPCTQLRGSGNRRRERTDGTQ